MSTETTFYRFLSEIRAFLSKLIKDPIKAEPSKYLKDRDFDKKALINALIKKNVLERHEKILDPTNSDEKKAKYVVKYKVRKKDFEDRIHSIYSANFKESMNECEGGEGGLGGTSSFSVGDGTSRGDMGYDAPFGGVQRRSIYGSPKEKEKGKKVKPENILGKTITAEGKKIRKVFITESQFEKLMEISTTSAGAVGDYDANGLVLKTSDGKEDPCAKAGKINVKMIMDK